LSRIDFICKNKRPKNRKVSSFRVKTHVLCLNFNSSPRLFPYRQNKLGKHRALLNRSSKRSSLFLASLSIIIFQLTKAVRSLSNSTKSFVYEIRKNPLFAQYSCGLRARTRRRAFYCLNIARPPVHFLHSFPQHSLYNGRITC
jgi:hypothetical protein